MKAAWAILRQEILSSCLQWRLGIDRPYLTGLILDDPDVTLCRNWTGLPLRRLCELPELAFLPSTT